MRGADAPADRGKWRLARPGGSVGVAAGPVGSDLCLGRSQDQGGAEEICFSRWRATSPRTDLFGRDFICLEEVLVLFLVYVPNEEHPRVPVGFLSPHYCSHCCLFNRSAQLIRLRDTWFWTTWRGIVSIISQVCGPKVQCFFSLGKFEPIKRINSCGSADLEVVLKSDCWFGKPPWRILLSCSVFMGVLLIKKEKVFITL